MKHLLFILAILLTSCSIEKPLINICNADSSFKDDVNKSIVDGFFDGDTTNIPKNTYFLK